MLLKSKVELDLYRIYRAWYRQIMKEVYSTGLYREEGCMKPLD